jgi:pimeloyl-ACP methyl ester carboxylesterase
MPDGSGGGQAGFHATRGWIFVACDSLGFGESTASVGNELTLDTVARGNAATVTAVMDLLESGSVKPGYPPIRNAVKLGIGQSMGGCFTIVQQAQHRTFDGIAPLGSSAIHTIVPSKPGSPAIPWPWLLRSSGLDQPLILNERSPGGTDETDAEQDTLAEMMSGGENPLTWAFHWDDEPVDMVALDMNAGQGTDSVPSWRSAVMPPACGAQMVAPGVVATEAASITVPILIGAGERDVVPNPWAEPAAFKSSTDVAVYVCRGMAHMHNFAHTRELLWQRIHSWGEGVAALLSVQIKR